MGYSGRYHATSLIAVFLALAIGILIGAEFGGDALTNTRKNLEASLVNNLQDARSKTDELNGELGRANEFADRVYPALTRDRLEGKRLAIVALGGLPSQDIAAVEDSVARTERSLVAVATVAPRAKAPIAMLSASTETSCEPFDVTVIAPFLVPKAVGVKVTLMAQNATGASVAGQLLA